jgi:GTP-dependent phosphoenolpyruvate carboxykinase
MTQTAIEWLHEIAKQREPDKFDWEQAKEMEKQQIIKTRQDIYVTGDLNNEQYYNQTFKQE